MKIILGLTGGSGSGKSVAADYLKKRGAQIIDADQVARQITEPGRPALSEIAKAFDGVIAEDGTLNRKKLGAFVFANPDGLRTLNQITHTYILEEITRLLSASKSDFIVIDAPLLLEYELDKLCTACIFVLATRKERIARIMERDGLTKAQAEDRINSQNNDEYYKSRCRFTVDNSSSITSLHAALNTILKEFLS